MARRPTALAASPANWSVFLLERASGRLRAGSARGRPRLDRRCGRLRAELYCDKPRGQFTMAR